MPHSWYHICLGLDTVSGHLRIVFNGHLVDDKEKTFFRNTSHIRPQSVDGKVGSELSGNVYKNGLQITSSQFTK